LEIDSSLALIEFYKLNKPFAEWIYRGSRRLYDIYKECQTSKSNVRHHGRSTTRVTTRRSDNRPHVEWDNDEEKENKEQTASAAIDDDIQIVPKEEANRKRKFKQTARKSTAKFSSAVSIDPMRLIDNELFNPSEISVEQFPDLTRVTPIDYLAHKCSPNCVFGI
jgi:hypothetical protein